MSRRGPRGLTAEEQALWNKVKERASAMHPERSQPLARPLSPPKKPVPSPVIEPFSIGQHRADTSLPHNLAAPLDHSIAAQPVRMDKKSFGRLQRGKLKPETRIDLHGMTLDRAHGVLNRFILDAHAQGKRLVLIITGKGKDKASDGPIPIRRGVLKHQVPDWLNAPALRGAVLQVTQAHIRHGGSGAYYVYLRRRR